MIHSDIVYEASLNSVFSDWWLFWGNISRITQEWHEQKYHYRDWLTSHCLLNEFMSGSTVPHDVKRENDKAKAGKITHHFELWYGSTQCPFLTVNEGIWKETEKTLVSDVFHFNQHYTLFLYNNPQDHRLGILLTKSSTIIRKSWKSDSCWIKLYFS